MNDPAVDHAGAADAYLDRARLGALIDTYRGAPEPQQPALASAAATALWLHRRIHEARQVNAADTHVRQAEAAWTTAQPRPAPGAPDPTTGPRPPQA